MPERFLQNLSSTREQIQLALAFGFLGVLIGLGQLLTSKEPLTARIVIGRAISTAGLSMAAGSVLVWFPDVPIVGQVGVAALLASLGSSGLERLFQRFLAKE